MIFDIVTSKTYDEYCIEFSNIFKKKKKNIYHEIYIKPKENYVTNSFKQIF